MICLSCKKEKTLLAKGLCHCCYNQKYRKNNPEKIREQQKKYRKNNPEKIMKRSHDLKLEVFSIYSDSFLKCACCGEPAIDVLNLHHIDGVGGSKTRNETGGSHRFYCWLKRHNYPKTHGRYFPKGLELLCRNCDWKERMK